MSLRYSFTREPGGPRYSGTERQAARVLDAADAAATLSDEALAAMVDEDGIRVVCDVLFELESNRLGRATTSVLTLDGATVAPFVGDVATLSNGKRVASTSSPAVEFTTAAGIRGVKQTWTDARFVNVVDVSEDVTVCRVTQVKVWTLDAGGTPTNRGTFTSSGGRISAAIAPYDDPIPCFGVFVEILAGTLLSGTRFAVVEVDPQWILDLSDDVESVAVEFAREEDPAASAGPFGIYAASSCDVTIQDTEGAWNPATNASLDVGHRVEVAFGVVYELDGELVEELLPAGVFYSDPFDTDSSNTAVTIHGLDRLGTNADSALNEQVTVDAVAGTLIRALAAKYLDLDGDQVVIEPTIAAVVIPYAYPSGNAGSYFADLANALGATMHLDAYDRLVFAPRTQTSDDVVAEITDATALEAFRRPPGFSATTSAVVVNASPLALGADDELWTMPSGGITIEGGESYDLVCTYGNVPSINGYVTGVVADGDYTITTAAYYADRAELTIRNDEVIDLVVADLKIRGNPLTETPLTARAEDPASVKRYGPRQLEVTARLVQTQAQVNALAALLLDAFRSIDDNGKRRIPDLTLDTLGLIHVAAGDLVLVAHAGKGLGGEYVLLSRRLTYAEGALLLNDARVREAPSYDVLTLDSGELLDDGRLVGF